MTTKRINLNEVLKPMSEDEVSLRLQKFNEQLESGNLSGSKRIEELRKKCPEKFALVSKPD